jgi:hypothetical protein
MNRAATLFLLLLATIAVVLVLTTEQFRTSPEWKLQPGSRLFDVDAETIKDIRLQNGDRTVMLSQRDGRWIVSDGSVDDEAAPEAVRAILRAAEDTLVYDRIDGDELADDKGLAAYGVLKSGMMFDFGNDRPNKLYFGKAGADPSRVYASFHGSRTVYLIDDKLMRLAMLPPDAFRDRRVVPMDPEKVSEVAIRDKNAVVSLKRDGDVWRITRPISAPADPRAVEELLAGLARMRFEEFGIGGGAPQELESDIEIRVIEEGRGEPLVASFGAASAEGKVAGRLEPRGVSVVIGEDSLRAARVDLDSLRDRALVRVNADFIDLVRFPGGAEWRRGKEDEKIAELAKALQQVRVQRFQAATPSALEEAGITGTGGVLELVSVLSENTPEAPAGEHPVAAFRIGKPQDDGTLPLHAAGAPEIVFIPAGFLNALPKP